MAGKTKWKTFPTDKINQSKWRWIVWILIHSIPPYKYGENFFFCKKAVTEKEKKLLLTGTRRRRRSRRKTIRLCNTKIRLMSKSKKWKKRGSKRKVEGIVRENKADEKENVTKWNDSYTCVLLLYEKKTKEKRWGRGWGRGKRKRRWKLLKTLMIMMMMMMINGGVSLNFFVCILTSSLRVIVLCDLIIKIKIVRPWHYICNLTFLNVSLSLSLMGISAIIIIIKPSSHQTTSFQSLIIIIIIFY